MSTAALAAIALALAASAIWWLVRRRRPLPRYPVPTSLTLRTVREDAVG